MKNRTKALLTILIIGILVVGVKNLINKGVFEKDDTPTDRTYTVEEYEAILKDTPSDIEGMTQYDKWEANLAVEDSSDTDKDGLTDKEEIETYGSDPHKASTADDMYSDRYKVENGMDVHTYYEYDKEVTFDRNECPEVILTAKTYTDQFATVTPMSEEFLRMRLGSDYDKYDFLKVYNVYNYNGQLSIKADDTDGIIVFVGSWTGEDLKNTHSKAKDGIIDVKYDFVYGNNYVVILAKKNDSLGIFGTKNSAEDGKLLPGVSNSVLRSIRGRWPQCHTPCILHYIRR